MLNLLLGNRLLAFLLLTAAICHNHASGCRSAGELSSTSPRRLELVAGVALVAWSLVLAGLFPPLQIELRFPGQVLIGFDSQDPIGWLVPGMVLFAVFHRLQRVPRDVTLFFWAIIAAAVADDRLLSVPFATGGLHTFQSHEGVFGLAFLLYPIAAFSGRMGVVGRSFGFGLFTLGFGFLPASILYLGVEHGRPGTAGGWVGLGAAAAASAGMIGLEELGGLGRGAGALIAAGVFMILLQVGSKRSTEVRA